MTYKLMLDDERFDHDLQTEETGMTFAKWLVEVDLDQPGFIRPDFTFHVHSQNPNGADNIKLYLSQYLNRLEKA